MSDEYFYQALLQDILKYYSDIEDCIIHSRERQGEWEDPTFDKVERLIELQQKVHGLL